MPTMPAIVPSVEIDKKKLEGRKHAAYARSTAAATDWSNRTRKFLVDIAKSAIGQNRDDIAGSELRRQCFHNRIRIRISGSRCSVRIQAGNDILRNKPLAHRNTLGLEDICQHDPIGQRQALAPEQLRRHSAAACWIAAPAQPRAVAPDRTRAARAASREWPSDDAQSHR